jgi:L-asparaginase
VQYTTPATRNPFKFDISALTALPKVGIIYSHAGVTADVAAAMISSSYQGIVHAGVGNGNIHKNIFPVLEKARANGIAVVRSSRVPTGPTTLDNEVDDEKYGFVASQWLNPQKSRVLLMLALTRTHDWCEIQSYFNTL